jgi:hypothetical protein
VTTDVAAFIALSSRLSLIMFILISNCCI